MIRIRVYFNAHGTKPWSFDRGEGTEETTVSLIVGMGRFQTHYDIRHRGSATTPCAWLSVDCNDVIVKDGRAILSMNIQSCMDLQTTLVRRKKRVVKAGGPGSGRHPGFGQKLNNLPGTMMDKYFEWVEKPGHNPDVLSWYHNLDQKSTEMVHKLVDKIVKDRDAAGNVLPKQHVDPWDKPSVKAGGPGSGRRPGGGRSPDTALLNKFHGFMMKHNPDMGNGRGVENYEHAANFLHNLSEGAKTTMHQFFDHMDKASGLGKNYSRVDHRGNLRLK